ncbi:hypothetical protein FB45DRAFT_83575 [Roridomyces roridus]|uniref:DUF6534 domain-containing protein n=1 Tax=Roridomyces roridus TaxID=1738132 RepID=A0AAD7BL40_9AGAR|nr:hypothetical protein FB45DRAFT_83575 [Roridomyces roridus]
MEVPAPFLPRTMSTPGPPPVDIPKNLGAVLIGALFASVFSGMSDLQAMFYFKSYKHDPLPLKILVTIVWIMDTIHLGFIWSAVWFYLIGNYGSLACRRCNPVANSDDRHSDFADRRLRRLFLCKADIRPEQAGLVLNGSCDYPHLPSFGFKLKRFSLVEEHDQWLLTFTFAVSAALDAVTSGTLVYLLFQHRVENGRYNRVLNKLIVYGLECGCLTFLGSLTTMLCWILMKNLVFGGVYFCMGKFYANVLLITLNSRNDVLRGTPSVVLEPRIRTTNMDDPHLGAHPIEFAPAPSNKSKDPGSDKFQISVQMERTVHYEVDESQFRRSSSGIA